MGLRISPISLGLVLGLLTLGGSQGASAGKGLRIQFQDRAPCLEKLICGIHMVGSKAGSGEDYTNQADMIRRYFKLYPLAEEEDEMAGADDSLSLEPDADSADDYSTDMDDIVHRPQSKNPKRKNAKGPKPPTKNKVVIGDVPVIESISLTGRRIPPKKKPVQWLDDGLLAQFRTAELVARASKQLSDFREGRKKTCGDITCPHTFKQIYESLKGGNTSPEPVRFQPTQEHITTLSNQNAPTIGGYSVQNKYSGLEGFFQSTEDLNQHRPLPKSKKKTKVPKRPAQAKPTRKLSKKQKKVLQANSDVVGTIAPPHKIINYRPPAETEEDSAEGTDDETDDINKTFPVQLLGHPDHDDDLKDVHQRLKINPASVYHREEETHDDEEHGTSDELKDDYDEEAKYEEPVEYGDDDDDDDDDDSEEQIRLKPAKIKKAIKKKKHKPSEVTIGADGASNPDAMIDYLQSTAVVGKPRKKVKPTPAPENESSEEADDDEEQGEEQERPINIDGSIYQWMYGRDPMNIGGRPMTAPGDVPIEMTSMGMRQRSGGGQAQAQPNLQVRERHKERAAVHTPPAPQKAKGQVRQHQPLTPPAKPVQYQTSAPSNSHVTQHQPGTPTDMSTGLSFSRLTSPFQSLFKHFREGNMFQAGQPAYTGQTYPHYQNQRPSAFYQAPSPGGGFSGESASIEVLAPPVPAPAPAFDPASLERPVGPESSHFKRYKVEKKKKLK